MNLSLKNIELNKINLIDNFNSVELNKSILTFYDLGIVYKNKYSNTNDEKYLFLSFFNFNKINYDIKYYEKNKLSSDEYKIINWNGIYELVNVCFLINFKSKIRELLYILFNNTELRKNKDKYKIIQELRIKYINNNYCEELLISYPKNKIEQINTYMNILGSEITCIFHNTGSYNSLIKSINSFINSCDDFYLINKWICLSKNLNKSEIEELTKLYLFIQFIFDDGNHKIASQLNSIKEIVKTKYILYLQNDLIFFEKDNYILPCLSILNLNNLSYFDSNSNIPPNINNKKIKQVFFNLDHLTDTKVSLEGYLCKTNNDINFIIDENTNNNEKKNHFFNNFSFRPSIFLTEILKLDDFEDCLIYEKIFGKKYDENNYISCYLDKITYKSINNINHKLLYYNDIANYILHDDYIFIENMDSDGNIIKDLHNKSTYEYFEIIDEFKKTNNICVCFNTNGKFQSSFNSNMIEIKNENKSIQISGTYLRKDIFELNFGNLVENIE